MAATIALGLAAQGRRVAVVTIDPARRLAEALGLDQLGNQPRLVDPARFRRSGLEVNGELHAMMLDAKRTFDELIARLAPDADTRDQILDNRIYRHLSTAVAGSQEYTAIAKLFELEHQGDYETIVLDTPPSRSAMRLSRCARAADRIPRRPRAGALPRADPRARCVPPASCSRRFAGSPASACSRT